MLKAANANLRILVADDDPGILELISLRLDLSGYRTFQANDGHRAIAMIRETRPNAVILDLNMPRLDGFGVLRDMQSESNTPRIPTMVLTASNMSNDVLQAMKLGARDFLTKPFNDHQLLLRVSRLTRVAPPPQSIRPRSLEL